MFYNEFYEEEVRMRRSWAVGLIIISILAMACGGAASVDDYKAAFVYVGPADDGGWSQAHDVGRQFLVDRLELKQLIQSLFRKMLQNSELLLKHILNKVTILSLVQHSVI